MVTFKQNNRYRILTKDGYRRFAGVRKTTKAEVLVIRLDDTKTIKCSLDHRFIIKQSEVTARHLKIGDVLGDYAITDLRTESYESHLYDPVEVEGDHTYLADNGVDNHNCDFSTSGDSVVEPTTLNWYEENTVREPIEKSGPNKSFWLWHHCDPMMSYIVVADVARGDGKDYSTYHILDVETLTQHAEYRDQIPTKDFARLLVAKAIEWNNALLVVENTGIGWDVVTTVEEMGYPNLYYSPKSDAYSMQIEQYIDKFNRGDGMVPGFGTSHKTRPLVVEKGRAFLEERSVVLRSPRLLEELRVFVWKNGKAQAQQGYNDDLVMPFAIGLFLRDTALRFRRTAMDLTYASLNGYQRTQANVQVYTPTTVHSSENPWTMQVGNGYDDLTWLLG